MGACAGLVEGCQGAVTNLFVVFVSDGLRCTEDVELRGGVFLWSAVASLPLCCLTAELCLSQGVEQMLDPSGHSKVPYVLLATMHMHQSAMHVWLYNTCVCCPC